MIRSTGEATGKHRGKRVSDVLYEEKSWNPLASTVRLSGGGLRVGSQRTPLAELNLVATADAYLRGHWLGGGFWWYWHDHGGLAQQGYPISDEFQERSDLDGKTYIVQYFERSVIEWHPANQDPYRVLLSLLGVSRYRQKYPDGEPGQAPNTSTGPVLFPMVATEAAWLVS